MVGGKEMPAETCIDPAEGMTVAVNPFAYGNAGRRLGPQWAAGRGNLEARPRQEDPGLNLHGSGTRNPGIGNP